MKDRLLNQYQQVHHPDVRVRDQEVRRDPAAQILFQVLRNLRRGDSVAYLPAEHSYGRDEHPGMNYSLSIAIDHLKDGFLKVVYSGDHEEYAMIWIQ